MELITRLTIDQKIIDHGAPRRNSEKQGSGGKFIIRKGLDAGVPRSQMNGVNERLREIREKERERKSERKKEEAATELKKDQRHYKCKKKANNNSRRWPMQK